MVEQLWSFHGRRALIPLLAFDTEQLGTEDARPMCNVLVAGRTPDEVAAMLRELLLAGFEVESALGRQPHG